MKFILLTILSFVLLSFRPLLLDGPVDTYATYFEWPTNYKEGNFIIGVLGTTSVNAALDKYNNKQVGTQKLEIKTFATVDAISKCHILYVPNEGSASLNKVLGKIKGQSTLLVTEKEGFAKQGAVINFVVQNSKQKFELSKNNAEKIDLKVSQQLSSLAIVVD